MKNYDFTTVKPDRNTDCEVYTHMESLGVESENAVPFAVAEMMFPTAPEISEALHKTVENSYFGYMQNEKPFRNAVCKWMAKKGVNIEPENIVPTHGVVAGLGFALRAFTRTGEGVMIQPPVYGPFRDIINKNGRKMIENPLVLRSGRYEMDFEDMEKKLKGENVKLFILCNPHNPVGRVWKRDDLIRLHEICARYGTEIVSDEIHQDILPFGAEFTPFATIDPNCVVFSAASKTFDIAGLSQAYAYCADRERLEGLENAVVRDASELFNPFGMAATAAAYERCGGWMNEMLSVVADNINTLDDFIKNELPMLKMTPPEGTYLCWVDMSGLKMSKEERGALLKRAGMEITEGSFFGLGGEEYIRVNVACPKECLISGLKRLKAVLKDK